MRTFLVVLALAGVVTFALLLVVSEGHPPSVVEGLGEGATAADPVVDPPPVDPPRPIGATLTTISFEDAPTEGEARGSGRLAGRLLDPEGRPLEGGTIVLRRAVGLSEPVRFSTTSRDAGVFVFGNLLPGAWWIDAFSGDRVLAAAESVVVPDQGSADVELRLGEGFPLRVQLLDFAKRPCGTGSVVVDPANPGLDQADPRGRRVVAADAEGVAVVRGLREGRGYCLYAEAAGLYDANSMHWLVDGPGETTIVLHRLVPVSGVVQHADGRPAASVAVGCGGAETMSDAEGRWSFEGLRLFDGGATVLAESEDGRSAGQAEVTVVEEAPLREIVVRLEALATIRGRVLDSKSHPIAGALVRAVKEEKVEMRLDLGRWLSGAAGGGGRHQIRVPSGVAVVGPVLVGGSGASGSESISFEAALSVVSEFDVEVAASPTGSALSQFAGSRIDERLTSRIGQRALAATSDEHGVFEITGVPRGEFALTASATGWLGVDPTKTVTIAGPGVVVEQDCRLVRGASVVFAIEGLEAAQAGVVEIRYQSDRDTSGSYRQPRFPPTLEGLSPGTYSFRVAWEERIGNVVGVVLDYEDRKEVPVRLVPTGGLQVSVRTRDGNAVAGAEVAIDAADLPGEERTLQTGADGQAVFSGLPPARFTGRVGASGFAPVRGLVADIVSGTEARLDVVVSEGATLRGLVVDEHGRPEAGISVFLRTPEGRRDETTDESGRFTIGQLPPGHYELNVRSEDRLRCAATSVEIAADAMVDHRVVLRPALEIRGRARRPDGRPLAERSVTATGENNSNIVRSGEVLPDGHFVVRGLYEGRYFLSIAGEADLGRRLLEVRHGRPVPEVEILFDPESGGGTVR